MLSLVLPTLNVEGTLPAVLAALAAARRGGLIGEIIVTDGGSTDATVGEALRTGCKVVAGPAGRGQQLVAGATAAQGPWLLFLHGDTRLEPGWEVAAERFMAGPEGPYRAAYFRFALDDASQAARRLERLVAWRCRWLALPYGDQGLLIHRGLYDQVGGFRPLPLMEDVDLVRRLGRRRLTPLDARALTSAGRFRAEGYRRRSLRNLGCLALYRLGLPASLIRRLYGR